MSRAALVVLEDFEAATPRFGWFLDNNRGGARSLTVESNAFFGSRVLRYRMTDLSSGQQEAIGQMTAPVDMTRAHIRSVTVQFDFALSHGGPRRDNAFNFGIGSSSGTPLTGHNQMAAEGADDRSFNAYIGWLTNYCRIQYQTSVGADGHGRGITLVETRIPGMIVFSNTVGTARMTLSKVEGQNAYDISVAYRVGSGEFVLGAAYRHTAIATHWDQILVGSGIADGQSTGDLYIDNVIVYTNGDPNPPWEPGAFRILGLNVRPGHGPLINFLGESRFYYTLLAGLLPGISTPIAMRLGVDGACELQAPQPAPPTSAMFFRLHRQLLDQPLDTDGDGFDDVTELGNFLNPLDPSDVGSARAVYGPDEILDGTTNWPVFNADTGPYTWRGVNGFPIGNAASPTRHPLRYQRFLWSALESGVDNYNFSSIDAELAIAESTKGLVWWAVYSMRGAEANSGTWVPPYLAVPPYGTNVNGTWLPDFNHPYYQQRFAKLLQAISSRYGTHPRFYAFDMRAWGPYGENNTWRGSPPNLPPYSVSDQSKRFYMDLYRTNFPRQQLFVMLDDQYTVDYILNLPASSQPIPIGIRADSWGDQYTDDYPARFARQYPRSIFLFLDRWKIAPVGGEPYGLTGTVPSLFRQQMTNYHVALMGNGNLGSSTNWSATDVEHIRQAYASVGYRYVVTEVNAPSRVSQGSRMALRISWLNRGASPAYRDWHVEWRLYDQANTLVWRARSSTDLRTVLSSGTPTRFTDSYSLSVQPGQYGLRLAVVDPSGILDPMFLAIRGRTADGSYNLGAAGSPAILTVEP